MSRRKISVDRLRDTVRSLFLKANTELREDVLLALEELFVSEDVLKAKNMLGVLVENARIARENKMPICQDTGMAVVILGLGTEVVMEDGDPVAAVNEGVRMAYEDGLLRKSVVGDPFYRINTGTNTPAVIHTELVPGDRIRVDVLPKGFGSENKGRVAMLNPTDGFKAVEEFCLEAVRSAGPDACPPYVLGVGVGGTMDTCAFLAKKALLRRIDEASDDRDIARLEENIYRVVRDLEIGIMGLGGLSTVMGVNVETAPTHIAGLPVAVNISCHALRSAGTYI